MWEKLRVVFTIPELRNKILLTLGLLAIYRIGSWIPLPIVDPRAMNQLFDQGGGLGRFFEGVATFSATQLDQTTIFGLGIMPYISASIIFQLLGHVWKPLEELQKEGETGRKKINEWTRYATVLLSLGQSWFYVRYFLVGDGGANTLVYRDYLVDGGLSLGWYLVSILTMTAGTVFLMWLGEQIDEYGIGNGISLLIMAGILARLPAAGLELVKPILENGLTLGSSGGALGVETILVLVGLFIAVVIGVVFITQGQRRISTQSAKHVRGRRVMGGTRQYLPLRVNQSGVMPIVFASSLLLFPSVILNAVASRYPNVSFLGDLNNAFSRGTSFFYNVCYVALIYFFCYFWTAVTFNPKDIAENLQNFGTFIPGYRPGKPTATYLERVMERITYAGAGFLALVAILPTLVAAGIGIDYTLASFYGGTGLLIAVSVAFDLVNKIDSHLVMRNYRGLLERT